MPVFTNMFRTTVKKKKIPLTMQDIVFEDLLNLDDIIKSCQSTNHDNF